jgi:2-dehydropantoate 2-reductase
MDELMLVGRAVGYDEALIPSSTPDMIMARSMELLKDSGFIFSALLDVRLGKPFELEVILGEVVRQAQNYAVPVPVSLYFAEC